VTPRRGLDLELETPLLHGGVGYAQNLGYSGDRLQPHESRQFIV
jgi:hypothetical protein